MTDHAAITACPLAWPPQWPRTRFPERSRFDTSFAAARDTMLDELRLLGARNVVISSNVPLRQDGLPYANMRNPDDPGVAVYFDLRGESRCIPVDKWDRVHDNLRAITLSIAALRGLDRWGARQMVDAAFAGFAALPAGGDDRPDAWWTVLGVQPDATQAEIGAAYRALVKSSHPDRGGSADAFLAIQHAFIQAKTGRS